MEISAGRAHLLDFVLVEACTAKSTNAQTETERHDQHDRDESVASERSR